MSVHHCKKFEKGKCRIQWEPYEIEEVDGESANKIEIKKEKEKLLSIDHQ